MPVQTIDELAQALRTSGLFTADQTLAVVRELAPCGDDLAAAYRHLLRHDRLSEYQLRKVVHGKAGELFIGPYVVVDKLGEGGMGRVYKAVHPRLGRTVALKVVRPNLLSNKTVMSRHRREAEAAATLNHPNIVALLDADEVDGKYYLAMEFVDGIDLARIVKEYGRLPVSEACEYLRQASLGLQHAHERGFVHRDIKPSNVLVSGERHVPEAQGPAHVKILDMGLVRSVLAGDEEERTELTKDGTVVGTPDYMSPEQAKNSSTVDYRADLYSLGCTLHFLLVGKPPFADGNTAVEKLLKHQLDRPAPLRAARPDVPPQLDELYLRLMAKKSADRLQSARDLAVMLEPFARKGSSGPVPAAPALPTAAPVYTPADPPIARPTPDALAKRSPAESGVLSPRAAPRPAPPAALPRPAPAASPDSDVDIVLQPVAPKGSGMTQRLPRPPAAPAAAPGLVAIPVPLARPAPPPPAPSTPSGGSPFDFTDPAVPAPAAVAALTPAAGTDAPPRRPPWAVVGGGLAAVAAVLALGMWLGSRNGGDPPAPPVAPPPTAPGRPKTPVTPTAKSPAAQPKPGQPPIAAVAVPASDLLPDGTGLVVVARPTAVTRGDSPFYRGEPGAQLQNLMDRFARAYRLDPAASDRAVLALLHARPGGYVAVSEGTYINSRYIARTMAEAGVAPRPKDLLPRKIPPGEVVQLADPTLAGELWLTFPNRATIAVGNDEAAIHAVRRTGPNGRRPPDLDPGIATALAAADAPNPPVAFFAAAGVMPLPFEDGGTFKAAGVDLATGGIRLGDKLELTVTLTGPDAAALAKFADEFPAAAKAEYDTLAPVADLLAAASRTPGTAPDGRPTLTLKAGWKPDQFLDWLGKVLED